MKNLTRFVFLCLLLVVVASAQNSLFNRTDLQSPVQSGEIKNIQTLDDRWGIAYTSDSIFRTADGGETWNELNLGLAPYDVINSVTFAARNVGYAVVSNNSR